MNETSRAAQTWGIVAGRWRGLWRALGVTRGDQALPRAILESQLLAFRKSAPSTIVTSGLAAIVIANAGSVGFNRIAIAALLVFGALAINLVMYLRQRASGWNFPDPRRAVLESAAVTFGTAFCWGILLATALAYATPSGLLLIMCAIVGVTAGGVLNAAALPLASLSFLAASTITTLFDVFIDLIPRMLVALAVILVVILARAILTQLKLVIAHYETSMDLLRSGLEREALTAAAAERERLSVHARVERDRAMHAETMAQQEARERVTEQRRREMVALAERFERSLGTVMQALGEAAVSTDASATHLADLSTRHAGEAEQTVHVARASSQSADALNRTAVTLRNSASAVATRVHKQAKLTVRAERQSRDTEEAISSLEQHADDIEKIVGMIGEIASQTNLLALNATIEAARAGETGTGFAVVANEVKNLAGQTQRATESITRQIGGMQAEVRSAAEAIRAISSHVGQVTMLADEISDAMVAQNGVTDSIASDTERAIAGIAELCAGVTKGADSAEQTRRLTLGVAEATTSVRRHVAALSRETQMLLDELRTA